MIMMMMMTIVSPVCALVYSIYQSGCALCGVMFYLLYIYIQDLFGIFVFKMACNGWAMGLGSLVIFFFFLKMETLAKKEL